MLCGSLTYPFKPNRLLEQPNSIKKSPRTSWCGVFVTTVVQHKAEPGWRGRGERDGGVIAVRRQGWAEVWCGGGALPPLEVLRHFFI